MSNIPFGKLVGIGAAVISLPFWGIWLYFLTPIPKDFFQESQSTVFLARDGEALGSTLSELDEKKHVVHLSQISPYFLAAVISTEDADFMNHNGVDIRATVRALRDNLLLGKVVSGASTITQQVARNYFHNPERNYFNKIREIIFALKIEKYLVKDDILSKWSNTVSFGGNRVGVEAAAREIFETSAANLDIAQSAFLAGIPQSPTKFDPFSNFEKTKEKQRVVLEHMKKMGVITPEQEQNAITEKLFISEKSQFSIAPHFLVWLQSSLKENQHTIHTSLDFNLQKKTENIIRLHVERLVNHNIGNAAALIWNTRTGDILAYAGNTDFYDGEHQGEVDILRSSRAVGSALKPFLYLLAFENFNWNPDSIVYDKPSGFDTGTGFFYEPQNYDLQFRGAITLRQALAESRNVPAVQILQKIGGSEFFGFLEKFGITTRVASESDFGLSAALGSFDIRPIDLAHAYGVLARGGRNFEFQIFKNSQNPYSEQIADCQKVFDIIDILSDDAARINAFHTKNPLEFPFAVAVKTGTTRNFRDNWTVGFSDQVGVLVWVGNADGAPMKDVSGITGAGPLFHALMTEAMKGKEGHQKFSEQQICGINSDENKNIPKNTEDVESVSDSSLHILSPLSGQTFRISPERPLTFQKLQFKSSQAGDWFVDGVYIGSGKEILWIPEKGRHEILIKAGQESKLVTITVL